MVGREFVPNEDMGEWTVHLDAPEGTSLEGSTEVAFKLLKAVSGIEGVAHIEPSIGVSGGSGASTHIHLMCQALPIGQRENTQAEMIDEMRRRLSAFPGYRPSITSRNALGSGEGTGGFAISANILGPDLEQIADVLDARARGGAEAAEPHRRQDQSQPVESRGARRRGPQARRRSRRADGDCRQHTAAGCLGRRSDLVLSRKPRSSIRSRCACSKSSAATSRRSAGSPCRPPRGRCASTTSPRCERGLGPTTLLALEPSVHRHAHCRCRAGPRARRGLQRRAPDARRAQHAGARCRTGCRDSRGFSTRRRPT